MFYGINIERIMKRLIMFIIILSLVLSTYSYARRVHSLLELSEIERFSVGNLKDIWASVNAEDYPWIEEIYSPDLDVIESNSKRLDSIMRKVTKDKVISLETLRFVIACLKHETNYFTSGKEFDFLSSAILPSTNLVGRQMFDYLLQHLIWFYNYWRAKAEGRHMIGVDLTEEKNVWEKEGGLELIERGAPVYLFHGTLLGIIYDVIFYRDGKLDSPKGWVSLTMNINAAEEYADPREREGYYLQELEDPDWPGVPFKSLEHINDILSEEAKFLPNKFAPVILKFKKELSLTPECHQMTRTIAPGKVIPEHEFAYDRQLSLNYLTYETKKALVEALNITEPLPWMDKEWIEIIDSANQ
jgi:hypothetical protein